MSAQDTSVITQIVFFNTLLFILSTGHSGRWKIIIYCSFISTKKNIILFTVADSTYFKNIICIKYHLFICLANNHYFVFINLIKAETFFNNKIRIYIVSSKNNWIQWKKYLLFTIYVYVLYAVWFNIIFLHCNSWWLQNKNNSIQKLHIISYILTMGKNNMILLYLLEVT